MGCMGWPEYEARMNESLAELNKDQPAENPSGSESSAFGSSQVQSPYTPPVVCLAATASGKSPSEDARRAEAKAAAEKKTEKTTTAKKQASTAKPAAKPAVKKNNPAKPVAKKASVKPAKSEASAAKEESK